MERIFIITINGKRFQLDPTGTLAITTDGTAFRLEDQDRKRWGR